VIESKNLKDETFSLVEEKISEDSNNTIVLKDETKNSVEVVGQTTEAAEVVADVVVATVPVVAAAAPKIDAIIVKSSSTNEAISTMRSSAVALFLQMAFVIVIFL
jgi:hypothetical protein